MKQNLTENTEGQKAHARGESSDKIKATKKKYEIKVNLLGKSLKIRKDRQRTLGVKTMTK